MISTVCLFLALTLFMDGTYARTSSTQRGYLLVKTCIQKNKAMDTARAGYSTVTDANTSLECSMDDDANTVTGEFVTFESADPVAAAKGSFTFLPPAKGFPQVNGKKGGNCSVLFLSAGMLTISFLIMMALKSRFRFWPASPAEPLKKENVFLKPTPAATYEGVSDKTPEELHNWLFLQIGRAAGDGTEKLRGGELRALQRHAAALESLVHSEDSDLLLGQLRSVAERTRKAREAVVNSRFKALAAFDEKEERRETEKIGPAVAEWQRQREKTFDVCKKLLHQATVTLTSSRQKAAAVVRRIDGHRAKAEWLISSLQQLFMDKERRFFVEPAPLNALQKLSELAEEQLRGLDDACRYLDSIRSCPAFRSGDASFNDISAEFQKAANVARRLEGTQFNLQVIGASADAWASTAEKAVKEAAVCATALNQIAGADIFAALSSDAIVLNALKGELPEEKKPEIDAFIEKANEGRETLKLLMDKKLLKKNCPLTRALRAETRANKLYGQLLRAADEADELLNKIYGDSVSTSFDSLSAKAQQELADIVLWHTRAAVDLSQQAVGSLSLLPAKAYKEFPGDDEEEEIQLSKTLEAALRALKTAENSKDVTFIVQEAQKAREFAVKAGLRAIAAIAMDMRRRCWLHLDEDFLRAQKLSGEREEGTKGVPTRPPELAEYMRKNELSAGLSFVFEFTEEHLGNREAAFQALAKKAESSSKEDPADAFDSYRLAAADYADRMKSLMAANVVKAGEAAARGLNLYRQLEEKGVDAKEAFVTLEQAQVKISRGQRLFKRAITKLVQAKTHAHLLAALKNLEVARGYTDNAVDAFERVQQKLEALSKRQEQ